MKRIFGILLLFFAATAAGAQVADSSLGRKFIIREFNWEIFIPKGFDTVSVEEWKRLQQKGMEALEKTVESDLENHSKTLFVFRSGQQNNYFEANWQEFDPAKDGDYAENCQSVYKILHQTFTQQMPDVTVDSSYAIETISGLKFHRFRTEIHLNDQVSLVSVMYNHLFGKRDFTVNIMYMDLRAGVAMLHAWKNSRFLTNVRFIPKRPVKKAH